jgi:hypothetical protein
MKSMRKFISLITLASFILLAGLAACHHHATLQENAHCSTCKIIAQHSALPNPAVTLHPEPLFIVTLRNSCPHPYLHFVFPSHGLSPPLY